MRRRSSESLVAGSRLEASRHRLDILGEEVNMKNATHTDIVMTDGTDESPTHAGRAIGSIVINVRDEPEVPSESSDTEARIESEPNRTVLDGR